jgi:PPOX class probable F420-dependent enzyme
MSSPHGVGDRTPAEEHLARDLVLWLGTTRPDGRPHVIPIWFAWDGSLISLYSKPHAQKVRNLEHNPSAMVAVGQPEDDMDVDLIEGRADLLPQPTAEVIAPGYFDKYRDLMSVTALTPEVYVQTYSRAVQIKPTRFIGWGGPGWLGGGEAAGDVSGHLFRPAGDLLEAIYGTLRGASSRDAARRALDE